MRQAPGKSLDTTGRPLVDVERLFFLHIAQTAGTTLNDFVSGQFEPGEIFPPYLPFDLTYDLLKAAGRYRYFRGHFRYGVMRSIIGARPTTVTMVRDPIERFLSRFGYVQGREAIISADRFERIRSLSLDAYLDDPSLVSASENIDPQVRMLAEHLDAETLGELKAAGGGWVQPGWHAPGAGLRGSGLVRVRRADRAIPGVVAPAGLHVRLAPDAAAEAAQRDGPPTESGRVLQRRAQTDRWLQLARSWPLRARAPGLRATVRMHDLRGARPARPDGRAASGSGRPADAVQADRRAISAPLRRAKAAHPPRAPGSLREVPRVRLVPGGDRIHSTGRSDGPGPSASRIWTWCCRSVATWRFGSRS